MPPQIAKSVTELRVALACFSSNASTSIVGGEAFSGISKNNVPPPAANAREPVSKPSQSLRPGSLKCTWESITPGNTCSLDASISSLAEPAKLGFIAVIFSSWMARSVCRTWSEVTTWALRMIKSNSGADFNDRPAVTWLAKGARRGAFCFGTKGARP